jgi:hypothetical protein
MGERGGTNTGRQPRFADTDKIIATVKRGHHAFEHLNSGRVDLPPKGCPGVGRGLSLTVPPRLHCQSICPVASPVSGVVLASRVR